MRNIAILLALVALAVPMSASAWWNGDWKFRKKILVNTSQTGADVKEGVSNALVSVRLHSGNFLFTDAKPDGADIRFIAADDKTPLKYFIEVFDPANQLALIWVQLPLVAASSSADFFYLYSGNERAASAADAKGAYDSQQLLALEFGESQAPFKDFSAYGHVVSGDSVKSDAAGLFGNAAQFDGSPLKVAPLPATHIAAGGGLTFSAWVRPSASQDAHLLSWGPLSVDLGGEALLARLGREKASGGRVPAGAWSHIAFTASDRMTLYVNGIQVATAAVALPDLSGEIVVGDGFHGSLDAYRLVTSVRPPAAIQLDAAQGADGKLLTYGESETGEESGSSSYIKVLFSSLTVDAKVVIAILGVMFLVALTVMINKAVLLQRTTGGNAQFLRGFTSRPLEFLDPNSSIAKAFDEKTLPHSSLARMYETGIRELRARLERPAAGALPAESVAAIKASIDATVIRENQRLNRLMVLLTIAISGGPFLGLLGTVVGVMITFASIAAAGDVNINAIAPGIAAALLATVAGLAVAIPSLFGYNYLITQIKAIAADMQAFSDEFICRMAEAHSQ